MSNNRNTIGASVSHTLEYIYSRLWRCKKKK